MMKRPAARGRGGRGGGRGRGGNGRGRGKTQEKGEVEDMDVEPEMESTVKTTGKKTKKNERSKTDEKKKKTKKNSKVKKGGKKKTKKVVGKFEKIKKMKGSGGKKVKETADVPPKVSKPKSAPLRIAAGGGPRNVGKVEKATPAANVYAIDQETTIGHIMDFIKKIDFGLELDLFKSHVRGLLPELNGFNLNIYWTTSRCGLKVLAGRATRDIASFSFNQCWGPPSYKLAVTIGICLELVPWLPFVSVVKM